MKRKVLLLLLALLVAVISAAAARAVTPLRPAPTPPDTESVLILHGAFNYPGYWWDHTELTVAVQAHPNVDEASLAAVHQAITDWDSALRQEFGGLITLTDVTDQYTAKHKADIVLHYNPTAGGTVFGGYAICGANSCPNVVVRSDLVPPVGVTYSRGHRDRVRVGAQRRRPISSDAEVGGLRLRTSREGQPPCCPSRPPLTALKSPAWG
jgi:hypothetical protein